MVGKRGLIRPRIGGAVYILPNLLTTGNLFFGYFSVIEAVQGDFYLASVSILLAAVFDILDGRIARLTNGTSEFGVQYDSLCDLVSFGLAPAFLMYQYALHGLGRLGWILCFIYVACGALRLARFNVQSSIGKASGDFSGLPIPMAAGVVACFVNFSLDLETSGSVNHWLIAFIFDFLLQPELRTIVLAVLSPLLAFLMVSNIAYRSHKSLKVKGIKTFRLLAGLVVVIGLTAYKPALAGFVLFIMYTLSGLFELVVGWKKPTDDDEIFEPIEEDDSFMEPGDSKEQRHD